MNTISKILALLFAVMVLIIPVAAVEEKEICIVTENPFSLYPHLLHISFTTHQELPKHAGLNPFFREDLIEIEEAEEISENITAGIMNNETFAEYKGSSLTSDTGTETQPIQTGNGIHQFT